MNHASILATSLLAASPFVASTQYASAQATPDKPNIIFLLADDLGFSDTELTPHNPHFETPNIKQLAAEGTYFTNAYTCGPNCAPTRACFISGMYTPRHHIYTPGQHSKGTTEYMRLLVPAIEFPNNPNFNTIPSEHALPTNITSIADVLNAAGYTTARFGKWHVGEDTQGFDFSSTSDLPNDTKKYYGAPDSPKRLAKRAITFIENHKDKPFFLFVSHFDVHVPLKSDPELVKHFKAKKEQTNLNFNPTYAAEVRAVDISVGQIRQALKDNGIADNTIVIFSSDNGGHMPTTTNKPLRSQKGSLFEGGIRVPTVIYYPGVTQPNTTCNTPINSVDFMPTFADIAGSKLPADQPVDGVSILPLIQGKQIAERPIFWFYPLYLEGVKSIRNIPIHGTNKIYWRGVPAAAVRLGDYKLIKYFEDNSTKLFDVTKDISETTDLSTSKPEVHEKLLTQLNNWLKETKAPVPTKLNPLFNPNAKETNGKKKRKLPQNITFN